MRKMLLILFLGILFVSCDENERKINGKWYLTIHDSAFHGDGLQQIPHTKPFTYVEFNGGEAIIDGKKSTYRFDDYNNLHLSIDGTEYKFIGPTSVEFGGKKRLMLTTLEFTEKDVSAYYFDEVDW